MRVHTWYVQRDVKVAREKKGGSEKETELRALRESTTAFRFPGNFRGAHRMGKMRKLSLSTVIYHRIYLPKDQKCVALCHVAFYLLFQCFATRQLYRSNTKNVSFVYD